MDEQISDQIALAQQASEGGVTVKRLFTIEFAIQ